MTILKNTPDPPKTTIDEIRKKSKEKDIYKNVLKENLLIIRFNSITSRYLSINVIEVVAFRDLFSGYNNYCIYRWDHCLSDTPVSTVGKLQCSEENKYLKMMIILVVKYNFISSSNSP